MDLKQLEAFVYVVKLNSFSKAAVTLYRQMGLIKTVEIAPAGFSRHFYLLQKYEMIPSPIQQAFIDFLPEHFSFTSGKVNHQ